MSSSVAGAVAATLLVRDHAPRPPRPTWHLTWPLWGVPAGVLTALAASYDATPALPAAVLLLVCAATWHRRVADPVVTLGLLVAAATVVPMPCVAAVALAVVAGATARIAHRERVLPRLPAHLGLGLALAGVLCPSVTGLGLAVVSLCLGLSRSPLLSGQA